MANKRDTTVVMFDGMLSTSVVEFQRLFSFAVRIKVALTTTKRGKQLIRN